MAIGARILGVGSSVVIGVAIGCAIPARASAGICPANVGVRLNAIADRPAFQNARWGIQVQKLGGNLGGDLGGDRQTLYDRDGKKLFIPASNVKLFTTALALRRLGASYRVQTGVYRHVSPSGEVSLVLQGMGDPSVTQRSLTTLAQQVAAHLKQQGIQRVAGLWVEDGLFGETEIPGGWEWQDLQSGYGAVANPLILDENALGVVLTPTRQGQPLTWTWENPIAPEEAVKYAIVNRTQTVAADAPEFLAVNRERLGQAVVVSGALRQGSEPELIGIAIPDPAERFLFHWQAALKSAGIQGWRSARVEKTQKLRFAEPPIAKISSPPLTELVRETHLNSNNLYAEVLRNWILLQGTFTFEQLGVEATAYRLVDGSGLSRANLASPIALVQVLQGMATDRSFRDTLPVAGSSGSLINRFRNTPAAGRVQAKTGFLTGAVALSGYITPKAHPPLVFSILLNHAIGSLSEQQKAIDEMVLVLADLDQKACR